MKHRGVAQLEEYRGKYNLGVGGSSPSPATKDQTQGSSNGAEGAMVKSSRRVDRSAKGGRREGMGERSAASNQLAHDEATGGAEQPLDRRKVGGSNPSPETNTAATTTPKWGIIWAEKVGLSGCPYLTRWVLLVNGYSIRLHHWLGSDDQRHYHDHPWWYFSLVLWNRYWEATPNPNPGLSASRIHIRKAGSLKFYPADHKHMVALIGTKSCWTLLITGKPTRKWGFWIPGRNRVLRPLRYFNRYGHHPCG